MFPIKELFKPTPQPTTIKKDLVSESIEKFRQILSSPDLLLESFDIRGSLRNNERIFPSKDDGSTIEHIYAALEAIDRGDRSVYRQNDETRAMVIVGAESFARFREHMKTSEALKYDAAAFAVVAFSNYGDDLGAITLTDDEEERVTKQKELQAQILNALQFEILRLEYESKTIQTSMLIEDPATPPSMIERAKELLAEGWDTKQAKSLDELHHEMILIQKDFDAIHQMMDETKAAYKAAKSKLSARIADDHALTEEIKLFGLNVMKQANECEERQNMSLAYESLRVMLLECCDEMEKQIENKKEWLNEAVRLFSLTLNMHGISEATKTIIEDHVRQFEQDRDTKSLSEMVSRATALLDLKSEIQKKIKADDSAYAKLVASSTSILACYDIPDEYAQPLRDELSNTDTSRAASEKLEALERCFNAANQEKRVREIEIETPPKTYRRYAAGSGGIVSTGSSFSYKPVATNSHGLFNHSTQNQYKNKQLLLGIGLILLGVTVLSITIMAAIATFGASAPLAALALPLSLSLAASGVVILGMAGIGLAATGGYALSK